MSWYVLYTKPKSEKKVAEHLTRMGVENYCPLVTRIQQWSDRKKKIQAPLFTSYVFVNLEELDRNRVFEAAGVMRYLFWLGKPAIVKDREIALIKSWLSEENVQIKVESISIGQAITLRDGPFMGQTGTVKEITHNTLRLVMESLGIILTVQR